MSDIEDREPDSADLAVESFLRYLERGGTPPSLNGLSEEERAELSGTFDLLKACWGAGSYQVPALEDDPLAAELGIVSKPAACLSLRGQAVKAARSRKGLKISQVAATMAAAGHKVTTAWVLDLEQQESFEVGDDLAEALAGILGVQVRELVSSHRDAASGLKAFLDSPLFQGIMEPFAKLRGLDLGQAKSKAALQLATAQRRSQGEPDEDEWRRLLITLLETWDE